MSADIEKMDPYFMQLVLSLQAAAMQQMGKVMSPISGKIERDLVMARNSIDMLSMLENKMKGNLSEEEGKLIGHILYELRLNYVDESKKPDESQEENKESSESEKAESPEEPDSSEQEKKE